MLFQEVLEDLGFIRGKYNVHLYPQIMEKILSEPLVSPGKKLFQVLDPNYSETAKQIESIQVIFKTSNTLIIRLDSKISSINIITQEIFLTQEYYRLVLNLDLNVTIEKILTKLSNQIITIHFTLETSPLEVPTISYPPVPRDVKPGDYHVSNPYLILPSIRKNHSSSRAIAYDWVRSGRLRKLVGSKFKDEFKRYSRAIILGNLARQDEQIIREFTQTNANLISVLLDFTEDKISIFKLKELQKRIKESKVLAGL